MAAQTILTTCSKRIQKTSTRWDLKLRRIHKQNHSLINFTPFSIQSAVWDLFKKGVFLENSADICKSDDHHSDGHHNETKTQGNLIQLVVAIRHGLFTNQCLLSNLCLRTTQHVRLTTNHSFKTMILLGRTNKSTPLHDLILVWNQSPTEHMGAGEGTRAHCRSAKRLQWCSRLINHPPKRDAFSLSSNA